MSDRKYTPEQFSFTRDVYPGRSASELVTMFNERFGTDLSKNKVLYIAFRAGARSGRTTQYQNGHVPANKGIKGWDSGGKAAQTRFKPGNIPLNSRPVGSERITRDGYIEVKVEEPRTWRLKHRLIWETSHGAIPSNHVVIFADGNPLNVSLENLLLVSRGELALLNKMQLPSGDVEFLMAGLALARLRIKCGDLMRKLK